ncbi:RELT-like protein 2 [Schistocerca americana]|uniref:RELT-like protein 2 n=1 Tax=Schistocerca americana TaxID=7009 RepID=UPI001F503E0A|nr:RELT-like protein 2 [Schistocerca americana]
MGDARSAELEVSVVSSPASSRCSSPGAGSMTPPPGASGAGGGGGGGLGGGDSQKAGAPLYTSFSISSILSRDSPRRPQPLPAAAPPLHDSAMLSRAAAWNPSRSQSQRDGVLYHAAPAAPHVISGACAPACGRPPPRRRRPRLACLPAADNRRSAPKRRRPAAVSHTAPV